MILRSAKAVSTDAARGSMKVMERDERKGEENGSPVRSVSMISG